MRRALKVQMWLTLSFVSAMRVLKATGQHVQTSTSVQQATVGVTPTQPVRTVLTLAMRRAVHVMLVTQAMARHVPMLMSVPTVIMAAVVPMRPVPMARTLEMRQPVPVTPVFRTPMEFVVTLTNARQMQMTVRPTRPV